jgi:hypothetical protein
MLSAAGQSWNISLPAWPWLDLRRQSQLQQTSHYNINGHHVQYSTELLVREVMISPKSCLRTYNPEEATLFYVPYLSSVEHRKGSENINSRNCLRMAGQFSIYLKGTIIWPGKMPLV